MTDATRRVASGAGWLYAYRWLDRLIGFALVVVLARLLVPEDFGLVAIAASIVAIVEGLSALDVDKALIRSREDDPALFDTAWTLSALRGLVAAIVMLGVAPFLGDSRIGAVLAALAASPLLDGLRNPRFVTYERELVYSKLAALTLGAKVVSAAVTLVIAVLYRSHWALVIGMLSGTAVTTLLSYALRPHRPRPSFARLREIGGFSGWLAATSAVTTLSMETDRLIVGHLIDVPAAGLYHMTQRVGALPTRELASPLQRILFPSFAELAGDLPRLRRVVCESVNVLGSLSLPAGIGFALVANDFVPLALGERWIAIVPLLAILTPYLGLRATLSMTLPCVLALGRTRLLFGVSLAYALFHVPAFVLGTALFALPGAVASLVLAGVLYSALNLWMLRKALGLSPSAVLPSLRRPAIATLGMCAGIWGLDAAVPLELFSTRGSWAALASKLAVGATVFPGIQYALWRLEGQPAGIERRLRHLLRGRPL